LADLPAAADRLLMQLDDTHRRLANIPSPYGDGQASDRCAHRIAMAAAEMSKRRA
jgi:hypothetical protein